MNIEMNNYLKVFFTAVFVYCLFSFKINLVGEVRLDDFLAATLLLIFFVMRNKFIFTEASSTINYLILFVVFGLFSALYNSSVGRIDLFQGVLFSIRHFEYFIFIVLGYFLAHYRVKLDSIFKAYLIYALVLIILQRLGVFTPISNFSADRAIANTGGPWELAAVSAFFIFFFFEKKEWIYFFLATIILILTESRSTTVAVILVLAFILLRKQPVKFVFLSILLAILLLLGQLLSNLVLEKNEVSGEFVQFSVFERIKHGFSSETVSNINTLINNVQVIKTQDEYYALTYGESLNDLLIQDGDVSALVRFTRWLILITSALSNFDSSLIGLGPSFAGKAVDGNYTRLFIETGFIGLALYLLFLISLMRFLKGSFLVNYVIILMLTAMFIDIFTTYKAMILVWVYVGILVYQKGAIKRRPQ